MLVRQRALALGLSLSEYGITRKKSAKRGVAEISDFQEDDETEAVGQKQRASAASASGSAGDEFPASSERDIFKYLKVRYVPPHQRTRGLTSLPLSGKAENC